MELGDELIEGIDWDALLEWEPPVLTTDSSTSSPSSDPSSWIDEIENLLMKEDDQETTDPNPDHEEDNEFCQNFLADILVESPANESDEVHTAAENDANVFSDGNCNSGEEAVATEADNQDADDPVSKKRRRQVRNRDAAVRSRERKKMYVKELEMKSKYLEGECRRLGRLLQFCYAENQALRIASSSSYAFGGSTTTKQESAVLFLESLLLGSLLWLVVGTITCLFTLPLTPPQRKLLLNQNQEQDLTKSRSENYGFSIQSFVKSRRCKASWPKMKSPPTFQFHASLQVF
ncbi:hypothetical protein CsatA_004184 [Cannabis sativa]